MIPDSAVERRLTLRLLAYWEKLRKGGAFPGENDINPEEIADLWDRCFMIHVADLDKADYAYAYLGKAIVDAYRHGLSEDDPGGMVSPDPRMLAPGYVRVIETGKPLLEEGEFLNLSRKTVQYRQCLLPLGEDGKIRAIFGGMHFRVFPVRHAN